MVIAVIAVRVMQVAVNQVVDVISVGNGLVATIDAVLVVGIVSIAIVTIGAVRGVRGAYLNPVLVDMAVMRRMQVSIVQEVDVIVVLDCGVATIFAMLVRMVLMYYMLSRHCYFLRSQLLEVMRVEPEQVGDFRSGKSVEKQVTGCAEQRKRGDRLLSASSSSPPSEQGIPLDKEVEPAQGQRRYRPS